MTLRPLTSLLLTSCFIISLPAHAQTANNAQYQTKYSNHMMSSRAPNPITEEVLKKRLDAQIAMMKRRLAFDKKQADVYAANFTRYQKQQADALKQMMAQAEKLRQFTIKRLEMQQQHILKQFSKYQVAKDSK